MDGNRNPVTDGEQTQLVTPIARRPSLSDGITENTFSTHIRIHQTGKPPPAALTAKKLTELQRLFSLSANIIENIYSYLYKHAHWQEVDQTRSGLPLAGSFKLRHTETASELSNQHSDGTTRLTADTYIQTERLYGDKHIIGGVAEHSLAVTSEPSLLRN